MKNLQEKLKHLPLSLSHLVTGAAVIAVLFLLLRPGAAPAVNEEEGLEEEFLVEMTQEVGESGAEENPPAVETAPASFQELIFIDIKGAVVYPNIYEMTSGQRLYDVVEKAGGFTEHADQNQVNLAQRLQDEMVIYIPMKGEDVPEHLALSPVTPAGKGDETGGEETQKININTADAAGLTTLNGIGEKKARMIIDYREEQGPFIAVEDIKNVSGIGEKSFENLKDSITVD